MHAPRPIGPASAGFRESSAKCLLPPMARSRHPTQIRQADERFGRKPQWLVGDTAYGAAPMLNWSVAERGIAPHIPVFDKSKRDDGTFSRGKFRYDPASDVYHHPAGKTLITTGPVALGRMLTGINRQQPTFATESANSGYPSDTGRTHEQRLIDWGSGQGGCSGYTRAR